MSESSNPWEALERAVEQGRRYGRRADHFKERALAAEAKIKAVEDVLEESEARGPVGMTFNGTPFPAWVSIATIRRALDGDA